MTACKDHTNLEWSKCANRGYRDPKSCDQCRCPRGWAGKYCDDVATNPTYCGTNYHTATTTEQKITVSHENIADSSICVYLIKANKGRVKVTFGDTQWKCPYKYNLNVDGDYVELRGYSLGIAGPRYRCSDLKRTFYSNGTDMMIIVNLDDSKKFEMNYMQDDCGGSNGDLWFLQRQKEPCYRATESLITHRVRAHCMGAKGKNVICHLTPKEYMPGTEAYCYENYRLVGDKCDSTPVPTVMYTAVNVPLTLTCPHSTHMGTQQKWLWKKTGGTETEMLTLRINAGQDGVVVQSEATDLVNKITIKDRVVAGQTSFNIILRPSMNNSIIKCTDHAREALLKTYIIKLAVSPCVEETLSVKETTSGFYYNKLTEKCEAITNDLMKAATNRFPTIDGCQNVCYIPDMGCNFDDGTCGFRFAIDYFHLQFKRTHDQRGWSLPSTDHYMYLEHTPSEFETATFSTPLPANTPTRLSFHYISNQFTGLIPLFTPDALSVGIWVHYIPEGKTSPVNKFIRPTLRTWRRETMELEKTTTLWFSVWFKDPKKPQEWVPSENRWVAFDDIYITSRFVVDRELYGCSFDNGVCGNWVTGGKAGQDWEAVDMTPATHGMFVRMTGTATAYYNTLTSEPLPAYVDYCMAFWYKFEGSVAPSYEPLSVAHKPFDKDPEYFIIPLEEIVAKLNVWRRVVVWVPPQTKKSQFIVSVRPRTNDAMSIDDISFQDCTMKELGGDGRNYRIF